MKHFKSEFPHLPDKIAGLGVLAENLWWSWNPAARMLFKSLDRQAWKESIHNPDKMLKDLPKEILERAVGDENYLRNYDIVMSQFQKYMQETGCSLLADISRSDVCAIAYFSAEYGLHHSLPFYAGGLGFLAGDHLNDLDRLKRMLNDRWRPVQIIFAGKAHPADDPGKRILQRIYNAARDPEMGGRIAFVEDYGEQLAQYLVHGVDVWLNNPIAPMEASGTSGMKAAVNGVPHLSILDGWWIEGFNGKNGWAVNPKEINGNQDQVESAEIYRILEEEVIPYL
jgi:glucan phosphorylase